MRRPVRGSELAPGLEDGIGDVDCFLRELLGRGQCATATLCDSRQSTAGTARWRSARPAAAPTVDSVVSLFLHQSVHQYACWFCR